MRKEENKFDQWLQVQLDGHESQLPHASWSAATRAKKRRKWFILFLLAGSSLAASLAVGFFLGRETASTPTSTLTENTAQVDIARTELDASEEAIEQADPKPSPAAIPAEQNQERALKPAAMPQTMPALDLQSGKKEAPQSEPIPVETSSEFFPIQAKRLSNLSADIRSNPKKLATEPLASKTQKTRLALSHSWDLSLESGYTALNTVGQGPNAEFYNELMKGQRFIQFHYGLGLNHTWATKNWQYSLGLQVTQHTSNTAYKHGSEDSLIVPSGTGSGTPALNDAKDELASQTLQHTYTGLSLPARVYYRFYTLNRFEFFTGLGLNLSYHFNQNNMWYSPNYGAQIVAQPGTFQAWKFGQEFMLSGAYRYRANKSIRLSYVLSAPKGQLFSNQEFTLNSGWQHSLRLQFYIP